MTVLNDQQQNFLESVVGVSYANPFTADRIDYERQALGPEFDESQANWNLLGDDPETQQANTRKIAERAYVITAGIQKQLKKGGAVSRKELQLYEDTVLLRCNPGSRTDSEVTIHGPVISVSWSSV